MHEPNIRKPSAGEGAAAVWFRLRIKLKSEIPIERFSIGSIEPTWPHDGAGWSGQVQFRGKVASAQFFAAPRRGGAFGSGLRSAGNSSNTAFIAVTALPCSAISLSASGVLALMSDTF